MLTMLQLVKVFGLKNKVRAGRVMCEECGLEIHDHDERTVVDQIGRHSNPCHLNFRKRLMRIEIPERAKFL